MSQVRKEENYLTKRNKAVSQYQKSALFIMWGALLNIFSAIMGVIQSSSSSAFTLLNGNGWPTSGFALGYSLNTFLSYLFLSSNLDMPVIILAIIGFAILLTAIFGVISFFSARGYLWVLLIGAGLYVLDFIGLFLVYHLSGVSQIYSLTNYIFSVVAHVIILGTIIFAIIMYYRVLSIEREAK